MSYLDDPRVYFAAERTLLAWQRTAIALISMGFVIERFGLFVRMVMLSGGHAVPSTPMSLIFGVTLLLLGAGVAVLSARQFNRFLRDLSGQEIPRGQLTWLGPSINHALAALALCMAAWFIVAA